MIGQSDRLLRSSRHWQKHIHRARLNGRQRSIPGWYELDWAEVERVHASYEPWQAERLVVDTSHGVNEVMTVVTNYLGL